MPNKTSKANQRGDNKPVKQLVGKKVLYISLGPGVFTTCPRCGRKQKKGMVSRYNDELYCSELCVLAVANG